MATPEFNITYVQSAKELQGYSDIIDASNYIIKAKLIGEDEELIEEQKKNRRLVDEFKPIVDEAVEPSKLLLLLKTIRSLNKRGQYVPDEQLKNLSFLENRLRGGETITTEEIKPFLQYLTNDIRNAILENPDRPNDEIKDTILFVRDIQAMDLTTQRTEELKDKIKGLNLILKENSFDDNLEMRNAVKNAQKRLKTELHNRAGAESTAKTYNELERIKNDLGATDYKKQAQINKLLFENTLANQQSVKKMEELRNVPLFTPSTLTPQGLSEYDIEEILSSVDKTQGIAGRTRSKMPITPRMEQNEEYVPLEPVKRKLSFEGIKEDDDEYIDDQNRPSAVLKRIKDAKKKEEATIEKIQKYSKSPDNDTTGKGVKARQKYIIGQDGTFGNIKINRDLLIKSHHLKAYQKQGRKKILDHAEVPMDLIRLLTQRYNPKYQYDANSLHMYNQLLEKAKLIDESNTAYKRNSKIKRMNEPSVKIYDAPEQVLERVNVIIGMMEAGNKSRKVMEELSQLLDSLLRRKAISPEQYKQIVDAYIL